MADPMSGTRDPLARFDLHALGALGDLSSGEKWAADDLARRSEAGATVLAGRGIGPGDRVLTAPNSAVPTACGITQAGAVPTFADVDPRNKIGTVVELEHGAGPAHWITYTPSVCGVASAAPVEVPGGHYFVLGDNRDHCLDSRRVGPVDHRWLRGKLVATLVSQR